MYIRRHCHEKEVRMSVIVCGLIGLAVAAIVVYMARVGKEKAAIARQLRKLAGKKKKS